MSSDKEHSPQHEELLKKQALEQQEVKEVLVFLQKYAKPAATAFVLICVFVLVNRFFKTQRLNKEAKADAALLQAQSAEDLQAVIDEYASTPSAPLALMELAKNKFNSGRIGEAEELFNTFVKQYKKHSLAIQAELNLITCKEVQGQLSDAHLLYDTFADKYSDNTFVAPIAFTGKARCLEALGQLDEAQLVYEDIVVNYPDSTWAESANASLRLIAGKKQ
jgi:TolA-binding protein